MEMISEFQLHMQASTYFIFYPQVQSGPKSSERWKPTSSTLTYVFFPIKANQHSACFKNQLCIKC